MTTDGGFCIAHEILEISYCSNLLQTTVYIRLEAVSKHFPVQQNQS